MRMSDRLTFPPGNPFPGMDPWMELEWPSSHTALVARIGAQLQAVLPEDLRANIEKRVFVSAGGPGGPADRRFVPDGAVIGIGGRAGGGGVALAPSGVAAAVEALPERVQVPALQFRQRYLTIRDVAGDEVVTVLELLSPSNKSPGAGRRAYRRKQRECMAAGVNVVEIDLTRGGARPMIGPPPRVDEPAYAVNVWRAGEPDFADFYRLALRAPLPAFRVPLRPGDEEVLLRLQPAVDQAHVEGGVNKLDHARPLDPPLSADDAAWARERIDAARTPAAPAGAGGG